VYLSFGWSRNVCVGGFIALIQKYNVGFILVFNKLFYMNLIRMCWCLLKHYGYFKTERFSVSIHCSSYSIKRYRSHMN